MSEVKVLEMSEAPEENSGKVVEFVHPYTSFPYVLGVFHVKDRYFAITDDCKACGNSLGKGKLNGMYVFLYYGGTSLERENGYLQIQSNTCHSHLQGFRSKKTAYISKSKHPELY